MIKKRKKACNKNLSTYYSVTTRGDRESSVRRILCTTILKGHYRNYDKKVTIYIPKWRALRSEVKNWVDFLAEAGIHMKYRGYKDLRKKGSIYIEGYGSVVDFVLSDYVNPYHFHLAFTALRYIWSSYYDDTVDLIYHIKDKCPDISNYNCIFLGSLYSNRRYSTSLVSGGVYKISKELKINAAHKTVQAMFRGGAKPLSVRIIDKFKIAMSRGDYKTAIKYLIDGDRYVVLRGNKTVKRGEEIKMVKQIYIGLNPYIIFKKNNKESRILKRNVELV